MASSMGAERVTILGGGISGLTAAWELTQPEQQGRYEVTVYQLGWRLGGKCASGRAPVYTGTGGPGDPANRVQEHGLHVLMGAYDNAFGLIQEVYAEAAQPPFGDWRDAFTPQTTVTFMEQIENEWTPWTMPLPVLGGTPGIGAPPSSWDTFVRLLEWIDSQLHEHHDLIFERTPPQNDAAKPHWWEALRDRLFPDLENVGVHVGRQALRLAIVAARELHPDPSTHAKEDHERIASLLHWFKDWLSKHVESALEEHAALRHVWIVFDLLLSNFMGALRDGLLLDPEEALPRVNTLDYREWLLQNHCTAIAADSAPVRALYDLVFAYPGGDNTLPGNVEAGTFFISLSNTIRYRGAFISKFNSGTADVVCTPMYEALLERGVRFEFFSRVDELLPTADGNWIGSIRIGKQVETKGSYDPLVTLEPSGERVWPAAPIADRIVEGDAIDANLESFWTPWEDRGNGGEPILKLHGRDFDWCILAIPPAAHPYLCPKLLEARPDWRKMVERIETVQTQNLQLWFRDDTRELGWHESEQPIVGGYDATGFDTWADLHCVLPTEDWPAGTVKSAQILCGPMIGPKSVPPPSDRGFPAAQHLAARGNAETFLTEHSDLIWPAAHGADGFDWGKLYSPPGQPIGPGLDDTQYVRANIDPSERYTQTVKDSTRFRLRAADTGYLNLFFTGDWIQNGQNLGGFDATVISGKLASRAISGLPREIPRVADPDALSGRRAGASGASVMPRYVEHPGLQTFGGEIQFEDVDMWAFLLEADHSKLAAFCQQTFRDPSGGAITVVPLSSHVMMTLVDIHHGSFPAHPDRGWSAERELTFWIPTVRLDERGEAVAFDMVMPFLLLDNPVAINDGREVYGYWKQKAWITVPTDPGADGAIEVDVFGTKVFHPDEQQQRMRALTMNLVGSHESPALAGIDSFAAGARALHEKLQPDIEHWHPSFALLENVLGDLFHARVQQLFLKQFRDVEQGEKACYQAITEAPAKVTGFRLLDTRLHEYQMKIEPLATPAIADTLGVAPEGRHLGVRINVDMNIFPGRTLWKA